MPERQTPADAAKQRILSASSGHTAALVRVDRGQLFLRGWVTELLSSAWRESSQPLLAFSKSMSRACLFCPRPLFSSFQAV